MTARAGLDWPGLMRLGLGELRLHPKVFWAMTPVEFAVFSGRDLAGGGAMTRLSLAALERRYPDKGEDGDGR
ncbi:MAG: phage tail assembly chaperone [Pseudomonadota bacterium]